MSAKIEEKDETAVVVGDKTKVQLWLVILVIGGLMSVVMALAGFIVRSELTNVKTSLDLVQKTVNSVERKQDLQEQRERFAAATAWTGVLMSRFAKKLEEMNEPIGLKVPDPLEFLPQ